MLVRLIEKEIDLIAQPSRRGWVLDHADLGVLHGRLMGWTRDEAIASVETLNIKREKRKCTLLIISG